MSYAAALLDPFDDAAEGCQVPDLYAFPTQTCCIRATFTLQSSPTGNFDCVVQPNPICTIAGQASTTGGVSLVQGGVPWTTTANAAAVGNGAATGFNEFGLTTLTSLAQTFQRYRVVAAGARLQNILPATTQQGTVLMAKVPSLDSWANYAVGTNPITTNTAVWNEYLSYYGLPAVSGTAPNQFITPQIEQLASSMQVAVPTIMLNDGVETNISVCAPQAFEWRDGLSNNVLTGQTTAGGIVGLRQGQVITNSANGTQFVIDEDFQNQGGWSTLVMRATGLPVSTNFATLDVIMHLEGVPNITGNLSAGGQTPPVNPQYMQHALAMAHKSPHFRSVRKSIRGMGRRIDRVFGHGAAQGALMGAIGMAML